MLVMRMIITIVNVSDVAAAAAADETRALVK
jgi:hypothetical protein